MCPMSLPHVKKSECDQDLSQVRGLKSMFTEMDSDGSNMVSVDELKALESCVRRSVMGHSVCVCVFVCC